MRTSEKLQRFSARTDLRLIKKPVGGDPYVNLEYRRKSGEEPSFRGLASRLRKPCKVIVASQNEIAEAAYGRNFDEPRVSG